MALQPGSVLKGHYRIDALIGGGGMALVYRAFDLNLQRVCAIKQNLDTTPQAQQQFHVEAIMLANLSHPHLARVTDHFLDTSGQQYLVMDFVDGENLDAYVARNGPLSERQALAWMRGIFDALAYCHSQGVIHRDVKPANLVKRRGEDALALVDFGIAKQQAIGLTLTGARAATPAFAPLEQFSGHTDAPSDVYALGATLYYLLSGVEPPDARLTAAGLAQLTPLRALNPQISAATERAVQQAMALRVGDRPPSVAALQAALQGAPAGPQPPPSPARGARLVPPRGARASKVALAGLALLAGLTVLLLALNWPNRAEEITAATSVATTVIAATNTATTTATPTETASATDTPAATTSLPVIPAPTDVVTATLDATRLPTATLPISGTPAAGRSPTSTPAVIDTPTPLPTSTPRPTQPPAPPVSIPSSSPAPSVVAPQLSSPPNGSEQRNQVLLQWTHSGLRPGQQYRVDLRTENEQDPKTMSLTSADTSLLVRYDQNEEYARFFKDDGSTFSWSVVVVYANGPLDNLRSDEWRFVMRRDLPPAPPTPEPPTPEPPTPEPPTPELPTPTPRG